jgi:hypothetical protein
MSAPDYKDILSQLNVWVYSIEGDTEIKRNNALKFLDNNKDALVAALEIAKQWTEAVEEAEKENER